MYIDCATCPVRGRRCGDCVVSVLLEPRGAEVPLDAMEQRAVAALVSAGMVTPDRAHVARAHREPWAGVRAVG